MNKKNIKKSVAPLLMCFMVAGGAAAFLSTSNVDTNTQQINAGTFILNLAEQEGSEILNVAAYPMTDEQGLATEPYKFSLTNAGTIDMITRLSATDIKVVDEAGGQVLIPKNLVKVQILKEVAVGDPEVIYFGTLEDLEVANGTGKSTILMAGENNSANYQLRAYVAGDATNEDLYGVNGNEVRSVTFKVKASAIQYKGGLGFDEAEADLEAAWDAAVSAGSVFEAH